MADDKKKEKNRDWLIWCWQGIVLLAAISVTGFYFWFFYEKLKRPFSVDPEQWGQFGDFIGGVLNPLMAFAAFYWLTQSVKVQKNELLETRIALEASAISQNIQAKNGEIQLSIASRTGLINALQSQLDSVSIEIEKSNQEILKLTRKIYEIQESNSISNHVSFNKQDKTKPYREHLSRYIENRNGNEETRKNLLEERDRCLEELKAIVNSTRKADGEPDPG